MKRKRKRSQRKLVSHGHSIRADADAVEIHIGRQSIDTALNPAPASSEILWDAAIKHSERQYKWNHHQQLCHQQQQLRHPMLVSYDERRSEKHTEMCGCSRPHLILQHHLLHTVHGQPYACRVSVCQLTVHSVGNYYLPTNQPTFAHKLMMWKSSANEAYATTQQSNVKWNRFSIY